VIPKTISTGQLYLLNCSSHNNAALILEIHLACFVNQLSLLALKSFDNLTWLNLALALNLDPLV
jgi:hypothetical protein